MIQPLQNVIITYVVILNFHNVYNTGPYLMTILFLILLSGIFNKTVVTFQHTPEKTKKQQYNFSNYAVLR